MGGKGVLKDVEKETGVSGVCGEKEVRILKNKKVIKNLVISAVIIGIALIVDYIVQNYIYKNRCEIVEDDFSHVFQIDSIEHKDNELILTGWVFKLGVDSEEDDYDIILYDYNNDKEYYMDVKDEIRKDVNEYFLCEYDYANSGFVASLELRELDLKSINYEVLIRPCGKREAYKSGIYISKNEIMFTEPESFVALDVEGTELEKIVSEGVLRVYRPDVGMYVYQCNGKLYWIADEEYEFEEDNSTYIQYQLDTTQINNLPQVRLENNWYWDNIGFIFEEKELSDINSGNYRITVAYLPDAYAIAKIWTGYHDEVWIWRHYFRPWYEFD